MPHDQHKPLSSPYHVDVQDNFGGPGDEDRYRREGLYESLADALVRAIELTRESVMATKDLATWSMGGETGLVYDASGQFLFSASRLFTDDMEGPGHVPPLEDAIRLAEEAHKGQVDKAGQSYIMHPLRVMLRCKRPVEMIVAVLHDVIEDTDITMDALRTNGYPPEVLEALDCVTKRSGEDYDSFVARAAANPVARAVKLADLEDNLDTTRLPQPLTHADRQRMRKYRMAYQKLGGDCRA